MTVRGPCCASTSSTPEIPSRLGCLLLSLFLLAACAKPLPPECLAYAGQWSGPGITLHIFPDGNVEYRREEGSTKVSIDAPIQAFEGDDFVVGVGRLVTRFDVTVPPQRGPDGWTMTVDGRLLHRQD